MSNFVTVRGAMVVRRFTVALEAAEEGGFFVVRCLELPVASQGETREEAIEGYLEAKAGLLSGKIKGSSVNS